LSQLDFFGEVSIFEFLFGTHWSPQIAIREDQVGGSGAFGAVPLFWGTLFISFIAMFIAVPIGLSAAIYLSEYAASKVRHIVKPFLEILAGVPTVVYGFFAAITIGPMFRDFGNYLRDIGYSLDIEIISGMVVSTESALAAGVVMGMMIVPFVLSLSDDVISAVPHAMRDGSTALGATKSETVTKVLIPAALPGIIGSFLLAISRAIGETMIVLMAAGVAAKLTANPFDSVTTITVQIVTLLTGDQEFDSVKTLSAFALALGLFATTLALNIIALKIVRKYREQYE
jgi:phosphate transport system permease protein